MRYGKSVTFVAAGFAFMAAGPLAGGAPSVAQASTSPAVYGNGLRFTPGLPLLDGNGASTGAAEPSIKVDGGGHVYVTGPVGVPTGGCPLWYIHPDTLNAQKHAYEYRGKFDVDHGAVGGGDCDIATGGKPATGGFDNLAATSLSLADITVNQSSDGGATFHTPANPLGNQTPGDDRQWNTADTGLGQVYTTVHDVATSNIQISSSTDGGYTYVSNTPAIQTTPGSCGLPTGCFSAATMDNHFGNLVVNPKTHVLYTVYVAPANAQENAAAQQQGANPNEHVVYVAVGDPCKVKACTAGQPIGPITWTDHVAYTGATGVDLAHVFPSIAIDGAGTVYLTWSDTHLIFLTHSTQPDTDGTWTAPLPVSRAAQHSAMFPWIVGGSAGKVDLVWYEATLNPASPACAGTEPKDDSAGVNNNCHNSWDLDLLQILKATSPTPTLQPVDVATSIHDGSLCDQGLNCNIFGGDRTLLDFFEVALDPLGAANVAFASDAATPGSAQIMYSRQCRGPSAIGSGWIAYPCKALQPGPPPVPPSVCSGAHVITDPSGDAVNPTGAPGSTSQVDITNVAFSSDPVAQTLTTTMTLSSLTSPPQPIPGTTDTYYYVVWSFAGKTYATVASEPAPDAAAFSYGEFNTGTNQLSTTNPATGSVTAGTPGTISVTVPLSGIGNPVFPSTTLAAAGVVSPYSLTISGAGALGSGLVFVHPDDRAPNSGFGPAWSVC